MSLLESSIHLRDLALEPAGVIEPAWRPKPLAPRLRAHEKRQLKTSRAEKTAKTFGS